MREARFLKLRKCRPDVGAMVPRTATAIDHYWTIFRQRCGAGAQLLHTLRLAYRSNVFCAGNVCLKIKSLRPDIKNHRFLRALHRLDQFFRLDYLRASGGRSSAVLDGLAGPCAEANATTATTAANTEIRRMSVRNGRDTGFMKAAVLCKEVKKNLNCR